MLIKDSIRGLNKIFYTDIPERSVILVTGESGTLKSGFVYNLLSNYLSSAKDKFGLYILLEENERSHIRNMESMGIELCDRLQVSDISSIRNRWKGKDAETQTAMRRTMLQLIAAQLSEYLEGRERDFTCFALDSLNALYSMTKIADPREEMFHLFNTLKTKDLTLSLVVVETPPAGSLQQLYGYENFLADGVIELGVVETAEDVKRYIQVKKMRAAKHSMRKHELTVEKDGISIGGALYEK